ncbi:MAG: CoA transferase [Firmicutes bacterium]|nr:CoA transferase [Bacillota bacterium]
MLALEGIRVLDLTRLLPGSFTTLMLADYGAEVIMVEDPAGGEPGRNSPPFIQGLSARHLILQRNKKSITLNLRSKRGQELFQALVKTADVLVENFRPGVMDRFGLGYSRLKEANSQLIYCSITGYGQTGPDRDKPGHDINYISQAGILGLTASQGDSIPLPGVQIADLGGGSLMAVIGILLALIARDQTGEGQYIDISIADGIISWLPLVAAEYLTGGKAPGPGEHPYTGPLACYNTYRTKDNRYLALGALEPKFWSALCRRLGLEEFIPIQKDPNYQEKMKTCLQEKFSSRTLDEWMTEFAHEDVCLTPVWRIDEALSNPRVAERQMVFQVEHPVAGCVQQLGFPIKLSGTPAEYRQGAPLLGEHNEDIFKEIGLLPSDLEVLRKEGVI